MLGLTFDKLLVIGIIAAVLVGPHRLPQYAQKLKETIRAARSLLESARARAETETGVSLQPGHWESWDIRQYDPRRLLRDALDETSATSSNVPTEGTSEPGQKVQDSPPLSEPEPAVSEPGPAQKPQYVITGSSGHPRRSRVAPAHPPAPLSEATGSQTPEATPAAYEDLHGV